MKIRSGFVSNSSSSSFICAVKNFEGRTPRVAIDCLKDELKDLLKDLELGWGVQDEIDTCREALANWERIAEERDLYIFDLRLEYGSEETLNQMKRKIPTFEVLDSREM